jgi:hypothetical protein
MRREDRESNMSADRFPTPEPAAAEPRRQPSVSYYRQNGIVVTSQFFSAGGYRYEITSLAGLMRARGSLHPGVVIGMVTAVAEAVIIVPLVSVVRAPVAWLVSFAALLIPCVIGYICARRWPPQYELLATYRGREVTLFTSRDEREFGQVTRAVQRALEAASS